MSAPRHLLMRHSLPVDLLRPLPADEMKAWRVGSDVGNVCND